MKNLYSYSIRINCIHLVACFIFIIFFLVYFIVGMHSRKKRDNPYRTLGIFNSSIHPNTV